MTVDIPFVPALRARSGHGDCRKETYRHACEHRGRNNAMIARDAGGDAVAGRLDGCVRNVEVARSSPVTSTSSSFETGRSEALSGPSTSDGS